MRWPPWRPDPDEIREREQAERSLAETRARRADVEAVVREIREHMVKNHLVEKAFAMRERGTG